MTVRQVVARVVGISAVAGALTAVGSSPGWNRDRGDPRSDATIAMAELLDEIARDAALSSQADRFLEELAQLQEKLAGPVGATLEEARQRMRLGVELVKAGEPLAATEALARATECIERSGAHDREFERELILARATAWLRLGEVENCVRCCNGASCLAPIEPAGVHRIRRGSENAAAELERHLAAEPEDHDARWLLNVAHMTLGTWPDGVPAAHRLPRTAFDSDAPFPRWRNVAMACGIADESIAGGSVTDDFNGDGWLDLMVSAQGLRDPLHLFLSRGDGTFEDRTREAGLEGIVGGLNLIHADYDNDGCIDVLVLRGAWLKKGGEIPNSLLRGHGDGTFEDVTVEAGLLSFHPTQAATWADFDGDGRVDLFIGNETTSPKDPHPCELYRNRGDGTFEEVAAEAGVALASFVKGAAAGDVDDDGRADLLVSSRTVGTLLFRNEPTAEAPGFRFRDVTAEAGVGRPASSFSCWVFDVDNDGRLDLFAAPNAGFGNTPDDVGKFMFGQATESDRPALYLNRGGLRFTDASRSMAIDRAVLVMGANFGDLDNDGWLDVYLGTGNPSYRALLPNKMFRNDGGKRFQDVTTAGGFGHLQKGHGVAFADFDNDGDQDVFIELGGQFRGDRAPDALFENPGNANRWITLQLQGVQANRAAIGARIQVEVATPAGPRSIHVHAGTGGSFGSQSLQQEIGLGDATSIMRVTIRWPGSGTLQVIEGLAFDRAWRIVEGRHDPQPLELHRFRFGGVAQ